MKQFQGFPARMEFTSIPNVFFSSLLPQISDMAELKTTLHILAVIYRKRGFPRFVTYREMLANASLMSSLKGATETPDEVLRSALEKAAERGTVMHIVLDRDGASEDVYLLNTEANRQAVVKIQNGELRLAGFNVTGQVPVQVDEQPNIYTLYEDNIGMLTPMIADELRDAEKSYPESWIRDAIKEAVNQGKRKWSYISAILEHWKSEGRSDGTYQRHPKKTDPDRFIKGKYGHMVRR
jgi:DNA replication protein